MTELDHFELDKPSSGTPDDLPPEPPERSPAALVAVLLVAVAGLGALLYFWFLREPAVDPQPPRTTVTEAPVPDRPEPLEGEAGYDADLPSLDLSDPLVRELLSALSTRPELAAWLATDNLIRNFAAVVDNVADGVTPARHLRVLAPGSGFQARPAAERFVVDPRSYSRYDGIAQTVDTIDATGLARVYSTLKPRIEDAYRDLGYPDRPFDQTLERAIVRLLRTPIVEGDVPLTEAVLSYRYVDPDLETLSPAQKQLLRMGPRNVRVIQAKLREVALALGIPEHRLPATSLTAAR
jgi:hypothetical protein